MEQAATSSTTKGVPGRKDHDGGEQVVNIIPLRKKLLNLEVLKGVADDARESFNDAVKAVAEETGLMSSAVKKLVKARTDDKVDDEKRKAIQVAMLFEEIGAEDPQRQLEYSDSLATGASTVGKKNASKKQPPIGAGAPPAADPLDGTDLAAGATAPTATTH